IMFVKKLLTTKELYYILTIELYKAKFNLENILNIKNLVFIYTRLLIIIN
ncbi:hypothetical protein K469DRAFT_562166, partial [Zopfia rhizophila CBS 207.26]